MGCWARYLLWGLIALLGVANLLTACGHKGPLYLPPPGATPLRADSVPVPPSPAPAPRP